MQRDARYFWLGGVLSLAGCSARGVAAPLLPPTVLRALPTAPSAALPEAESPPLDRVAEDEPRLVPALDGSSTSFMGEERDGSQRLIAFGLRVLARPGGAIELAREYLPAPRNVQALELPLRLGGGYLFSVLTSGNTLLFRAPTFIGPLSPFARLDFEAEQVIVGFDRLYVSSRPTDRLIALDAERGTSLGLGSLPRSPNYDKLAFADGWLGAVQVPFRGTLLSFDAGISWRPSALRGDSLYARDGKLFVTTRDGRFEIDETGTVTRQNPPTSTDSNENAIARALRASVIPETADRSERGALKRAVLRGVRDRDGSLLVASGGTLLRVRASDGQVLERDQHAFAGSSDCTGLPIGNGLGFACSEEGHTSLYSFEAPFALRRRQTFGGARYVAASGNGALVVRGTCEGGPLPGAYCVSTDGRAFREIRVRGDLGVERVVALSDGRVAVIVPPRLGAPGFLSLIDAHGKEQRIPLQLPSSGAATNLLDHGLWLDGFVERAGKLAGWVAGAEPFAGVRVALDGNVSIARAESSIDRALLSGTRALLVSRSGRTRESIDGGFEWSDVELPSEFDAGRELQGDARLQGCSEIGCSFAGFVRVGWGPGNAAQRLHIAKLPESTPLLQPGGSRWSLACQATGEVSEPALPLASRASPPSRTDDAPSAPWAPFYELAAPTLGTAETGFDVFSSDADTSAVHAYVWGERGPGWAHSAHTLVRAFDRYEVHRALIQSAVTRSPWSDATSAAEAFGFDSAANSSSVRAVFDAGQRAAAVLLSSRGLLDILLLEEGKSVARIANAARLGQNLGMMSSLAKVGDAWYVVAFNENHALVLSRISGGQVERLAEYPDLARDISAVRVVRGSSGEELAIWVSTGLGWYLFPLDPKTYAIEAPLYRSAAELAKIPSACASDADGFLLVGSPSLEIGVHAVAGADPLIARSIEGQFIWSASGLCTRALAADGEIQPTHGGNARPAASAKLGVTVPLTLTERRPLGRRWGFVCAP